MALSDFKKAVLDKAVEEKAKDAERWYKDFVTFFEKEYLITELQGGFQTGGIMYDYDWQKYVADPFYTNSILQSDLEWFASLYREESFAIYLSTATPVNYQQIRPFREYAEENLAHRLHEKGVQESGFTGGIIHFGNNNTKKDVGVATKGFAEKIYGGHQLGFANIQEVYSKMNNLDKEGEEIKKAVAYVRNVNNAPSSCTRLEWALRYKEKIYFHLDLFNDDIVDAIMRQDESFHAGSFYPVKNSVTAQELYHICKNWDRFKNNVSFFRNFQPVRPPKIKTGVSKNPNAN